METFMVRIYRRDKEDSDKIDGHVEMVGAEDTETFHDMAELCRLLTPGCFKKKKSKKGNKA